MPNYNITQKFVIQTVKFAEFINVQTGNGKCAVNSKSVNYLYSSKMLFKIFLGMLHVVCM